MRKNRIFAVIAFMGLMITAFTGCGNNYGTIASPSNLSKKPEETQEKMKGDYYVSVNGSDENSGTSPESPFKTLSLIHI